MLCLTPLIQNFCLSSESDFVSSITGGKWIFIKCSGQVGYSIRNIWLDGFISCSTLLKLGMSEVCVLKYTIRGSFNAGTLSNCTVQWRHNERDSVSNHQPRPCLLNRLFRRRSKKTPKLCVTDHYLSQWWLSNGRIYASPGLIELILHPT